MTSAAFIVALKAQLDTRFSALSSDFTNVTTHVWRADVQAPSVILIRDRVRTDVEYVAMGHVRTETVTVPALVGTIAPTIEAAVAQAEAIIEEIAQEIRDDPPQAGARVYDAITTNYAWQPLPTDKGGVVCDFEFDIEYTADL